MRQTMITFCGQKAKVLCDEKCSHAWGVNGRPRQPDNEDEFLSDKLAGVAFPTTTSCGGHVKPIGNEPKHNRWCIGECERLTMSAPGKYDDLLVAKTF